MTDRPLVVMESYTEIKPTTNPYLAQLDSSLRATEGLTVVTFGVRTALIGRYDVFHVHWPENLFGGHTLKGRVARRLVTSLFLLRLTLTRTPIVRTMHNLHRPDGLSRIDHLLLDWIDRLTAVQIQLNDTTDVPPGRSAVTIPHGHYRDWFAPFTRPDPTPGQIGYIGLIRRYKGVEDLLAAFADLPELDATLQVTGKPSSDELRSTLEELAAVDPRVRLRLEFVDEPEFAADVSRSTLIVMPYRHMHNSGVALAALSLSRPVLVPDTEVNRALAAEVGPGWVHTFSEQLSAAELAAAVAAVAHLDPGARPDLSAREWTDAGPAHLAAFALGVGRPGDQS